MDPTKFAIAQSLPEIYNEFAGNNPQLAIILKAPTGSGKSLGVPWFFAKAGVRMFVTETRINSAVSLSVAQEEISPSYTVGYGAETEVTYNTDPNAPQIAYVTAGHLLRKVLRNISDDKDPYDFVDMLMIDDPDSVDDSVNLALWQYFAKLGKPVPRLIMASATINPLRYPNIKVVELQLQTYAVQQLHHAKSYATEDRNLYTDMAEIVRLYHESTLQGHFMVFCPGKQQIDEVINYLTARINDAAILPVYGRMKQVDIRNIYNNYPDKKRKIIVSTNLTETAVTIDGLVAVFDSMTVKLSYTTPVGGNKLKVMNISKEQSIQRRGRVGRTMPGYYYAMCTAESYDKLLPAQEPPIEREPLYNVTMELMAANLDPLVVLPQYSKIRFEETSVLLQQLKMIKKTITGWEVTEIGKFSPKVPLSVRNSTFLYNWWKHSGAALYPGIVMAVLIDTYGPSLLFYPGLESGEEYATYKDRMIRYTNQNFSKFKADDDLQVYMKIWLTFSNDLRTTKRGQGSGTGPLTASKHQIKDWCQMNKINNKKMTEIVRTVRLIVGVMQRIDNDFDTRRMYKDLKFDNITQLFTTAQPYLEEAYLNKIMKSTGAYPEIIYYKSLTENIIYRLSRRYGVSTMVDNAPEYAISLVDISQQRDGKTSNIISFAVPASRSAEDVVQQPSAVITTTPITDDQFYIPGVTNLPAVPTTSSKPAIMPPNRNKSKVIKGIPGINQMMNAPKPATIPASNEPLQEPDLPKPSIYDQDDSDVCLIPETQRDPVKYDSTERASIYEPGTKSGGYVIPSTRQHRENFSDRPVVKDPNQAEPTLGRKASGGKIKVLTLADLAKQAQVSRQSDTLSTSLSSTSTSKDSIVTLSRKLDKLNLGLPALHTAGDINPFKDVSVTLFTEQEPNTDQLLQQFKNLQI